MVSMSALSPKMWLMDSHMKGIAIESMKRPVNIEEIQRILRSLLAKGEKTVSKKLDKTFRFLYSRKSGVLHSGNLILAVAREVGKSDPSLAISLVEKHLNGQTDNRLNKALAELYLNEGYPLKAMSCIVRIDEDRVTKRLMDRIRDVLNTNQKGDVGVDDLLIHHSSSRYLTDAGYRLLLPVNHIIGYNKEEVLSLSGEVDFQDGSVINGALVAIEFFDEKGERIPHSKEMLLKPSGLVGSYQYINPEYDGTFSIPFRPPENSVQMVLNFRNWKNSSGVKLGSILEVATSEQFSILKNDLQQFVRHCRISEPGMMVLFYGSASSKTETSMERSCRIIDSLVENGVPVINVFNRNHRRKMDLKQRGNMLTVPIDICNGMFTELKSTDFGGVKRVLLVNSHSPAIGRNIHRFRKEGWIIVTQVNAWVFKNNQLNSDNMKHLVLNSDRVIAASEMQVEACVEVGVAKESIILSPNGLMELESASKVPSKYFTKIGIIPRRTEDLDFNGIRLVCDKFPDYSFDLLGAVWPVELPIPKNLKNWTIRNVRWLKQMMSEWDLAIDLPIKGVEDMPPGIEELRRMKTPCVVGPLDGTLNPKAYVIRFQNNNQLLKAIDEGLSMDKSFVPSGKVVTWEDLTRELISTFSEVSTNNETSNVDYLPLSNLIKKSRMRPPRMKDIASEVRKSFNGNRLGTFNDIHWAVDYLSTDIEEEKTAVNLLIGAIRGIGQEDPFIAINLAEDFPIEDKRYLRTMVTMNNRIDRYETSLKILEKMRNSKWKREMQETLNRRVMASVKMVQKTGFFPILPAKKTAEPKRNLKVACLLDRFSFDSFSFEVQLEPIPRKEWKEFLDNGDFDFLLAESIWKGHDEQWRFAMSSPDTPNGKALFEMLDYCSSIGLPKVFWNKEDPVNYDRFIPVAKEFDYIFTSDNNSIDDYLRDCDHENVFALSFACQPIIHNPIRNQLPNYEVCFAGSWYVREHGDRKRQTKLLVDAARNHNLHIYDRFHGTGDRNQFPKEYSQYVRGSLPYDECCMAYRAYDVFLNVNSVMGSDTMFSRRVYEILASSTHVISTPSIGMEKLLPEGVKVVDDLADAEQALESLLSNAEEREKQSHLGYRNVLNNHTYTHRIGEILAQMDIEDPLDKQDTPLISLITCTNRPSMIDNILENLNRQIWTNIEHLLIIECDDDDDFEMVLEKASSDTRMRVIRVDSSMSLGHCFNLGMEESSGDYVAKFDDDDYYGPHYLSDQMLCFDYTDADMVGKLCTYMYHEKSDSTYLRFAENRHKYSDLILGPTFLFTREVADKVRMKDLSRGEDTQFLKDCINSGFKIYSTDPYNFVYVRRKIEGFHTWDATDDMLLKKATKVEADDPKKYTFI